MNRDELRVILDDHVKYLTGRGGARADLYGANLHAADLSGADLSRANLHAANLSEANLSRANLSRANLSGTYLYGANLHAADLSGANLYGANLPLEMSVSDWCDAQDLATLPNGHRVAFKRLEKGQTTGTDYGNPIKWSRGKYVEAPDWSPVAKCGWGLHLSPTPYATRSHSYGEICIPVSFAIEDAVHIGDKLKVRRCKVL